MSFFYKLLSKQPHTFASGYDKKYNYWTFDTMILQSRSITKTTNQTMEQRLTVLTIGARNLPLMKDFYEQKLGWKPTAENKDIIFYQMNGFLFSIAEKGNLATFLGTALSEHPSFTFGYNVKTEQEVKDIYKDLVNKDVEIIKGLTVPPFGGLFFYFKDVEGNIIEVACNSYISLDENDNATGHKSIKHL
jgi:catechol 2,3-dioxygenase-like lactoylglutathione lyase family enzyme